MFTLYFRNLLGLEDFDDNQLKLLLSPHRELLTHSAFKCAQSFSILSLGIGTIRYYHGFRIKKLHSFSLFKYNTYLNLARLSYQDFYRFFWLSIPCSMGYINQKYISHVT